MLTINLYSEEIAIIRTKQARNWGWGSELILRGDSLQKLKLAINDSKDEKNVGGSMVPSSVITIYKLTGEKYEMMKMFYFYDSATAMRIGTKADDAKLKKFLSLIGELDIENDPYEKKQSKGAVKAPG